MSNVSTKITEAKETFQTVLEISRLLCTGLDPETLLICMKLCEAGVNPEALASIINDLRRETENLEMLQKESQE